MKFTNRKPQKELVQKLYRVLIGTVKPFTLMSAPVYLYFKANEKFVSVKAPLDFFTGIELERLKTFEYFYFPDFVYSAMPFREAGQRARAILAPPGEAQGKRSSAKVILAPASYEISDALLRIVGPLWWEYSSVGPGIDPFLMTVFVNELCDLIPEERLIAAREKYVEGFERALVRSSWVTFLALILGYCEMEFLNNLRLRIFDENMEGDPGLATRNEIDELIELAYSSLGSSELNLIRQDFFYNRPERVAQKLGARLERIEKELLSRGNEPPTIFGERGFIDV